MRVYPDGECLRVVTWVDDLIVRGPLNKMETFFGELGRRFDVKDPNFLTPTSKLSFVGMDIEEREGDHGMVRVLHQTHALEHFLEGVGVGANPMVKCPMPKGSDLYKDDTLLEGDEVAWYQMVVGTLNYFA